MGNKEVIYIAGIDPYIDVEDFLKKSKILINHTKEGDVTKYVILITNGNKTIRYEHEQ